MTPHPPTRWHPTIQPDDTPPSNQMTPCPPPGDTPTSIRWYPALHQMTPRPVRWHPAPNQTTPHPPPDNTPPSARWKSAPPCCKRWSNVPQANGSCQHRVLLAPPGGSWDVSAPSRSGDGCSSHSQCSEHCLTQDWAATTRLHSRNSLSAGEEEEM